MGPADGWVDIMAEELGDTSILHTRVLGKEVCWATCWQLIRNSILGPSLKSRRDSMECIHKNVLQDCEGE